jgi:hypothetical protein
MAVRERGWTVENVQCVITLDLGPAHGVKGQTSVMFRREGSQ